MSLTAYAREVMAGKAMGTPDPPAPASTVTDEVTMAVSEAQAALMEAGQSEAFRGDPYAIVLHGLSLVLGVFPRLVHRLERVRSEPPPVLTGEERVALHREMTDAVRAAALAGTKQSALGLARAIDGRFAGWWASRSALPGWLRVTENT
jgi:hypothetical protein